jgi:RNA polymerase sigma-70 factor (ECF subfamily)
LLFLGAFLLSADNSPNKPSSESVTSSSTGSGAVEASDPYAAERRQDRADIVRHLSGDSGGFEDIMTRYRARAYGIAVNLTGNHDDAMDAMQKSFIRIHRSLDKFRLDDAFFPWLYRIVRNTALNQKRDENRHRGDCPLEWVEKSDGKADPLAATMAADLRERIWQGLQALPEDMRLVFHAYHFEGLKYREISESMGLPLGTVMSRLHAARTKLRATVDWEDA